MTMWRVGRKLGRTLYRDEQLVGMVDSPEIALEIVAAMRVAERLVGGGGREPSLPPGIEVRREDRSGTVVAVSEQVVFCALCPDPPWPSREFHPTGQREHRGTPTPPRDHIAGVTGCDCTMCRAPESGRERSPEVITHTEHDRIEEQLRKRSLPLLPDIRIVDKDCTCGPYGGCDG